jgi:hypothetical protein
MGIKNACLIIRQKCLPTEKPIVKKSCVRARGTYSEKKSLSDSGKLSSKLSDELSDGNKLSNKLSNSSKLSDE